MGMFDGISAQDLRDRSWEFEEFQAYIKQEGKKWGNSSQFKAVVSAMNTYSKLRGQEITPESAIQIVNANDALMKACDDYINHKTSQLTSNKKKEFSEDEKKRITALQILQEYQKELNYSEVRDMRVVRSLAGKTWDAAVPFKTKEAVLEGKVEVSGANVSERIKLEVGGRKGFFTNENVLDVNRDRAFHQMLAETKDPRRKELFEKNRFAFEDLTGNDGAMPRKIPPKMLLNNYINHYIRSALEKLEPDDPKREQYELLEADSALKTYYVKIEEKQIEGTEDRKAYFEEYCNKDRKGDKHAQILMKYEDFILSMPLPDKEMKLSAYQMMVAENTLLKKRQELLEKNKAMLEGADKDKKETLEKIQENKKQFEEIGELLADKQGIRQLSQTAARFDANMLAMSFIDEDNKKMELTARNIATSRLAELIGAGNVVAHSEKMIVKTGDKVMSGCFMEFAKGIDPTSTDPRELKKISEVEFSLTPSFLKDMTNMEILDYLCNQADRHAYNMFYQVSEPDAQGKRNIIGIQGIDNDLAFGSYDSIKTGHQSREIEQDMIFIDKSVADRVKKLDSHAIDYALGDILPKNQVDLVKKRLETFKQHMKENMVVLEGDEWELKEYSIQTPPDQLDKRGQQYVQGLKSLQGDFEEFSKRSHKITQVRDAIKATTDDLVKLNAKEEKLYEGVRNIFDEPEPEKQAQAEAKESQKQVQAKAKEPEKQVQAEAKEPKKQAQAEAKEPQKQTPPLPTRRKVGLGQFEQQTPRTPMIGKGRSVPNKENTAQQEKKAENPQRVQTNFQRLSGARPAASQRKSLIGNHQNQAERKQEKGRSMG